jgi:hypothetical protein
MLSDAEKDTLPKRGLQLSKMRGIMKYSINNKENLLLRIHNALILMVFFGSKYIILCDEVFMNVDLLLLVFLCFQEKRKEKEMHHQASRASKEEIIEERKRYLFTVSKEEERKDHQEATQSAVT